MQIIPVRAVPSQNLQVQLGDQAVTLDIYQLDYGLFMDVYVGNTLIIAGVICLNLNRIVRSLYLGFNGDFAWCDTKGDTDPVYTGLGDRYLLGYFEASEVLERVSA
jgi:hypothetical protein